MVPLAVVGTGLVTPLALTPSEHAFFVRAGVGAPITGAFKDAAGERISAAPCAWIGATAPVGQRLELLVRRTLAAAIAPWPRTPTATFVCTAAPRTGLVDADRSAAEDAAARVTKSSRPGSRLTGAAGFFQALIAASTRLEADPEGAVAVVAVDSLISPAFLAEWSRLATTPWESNLPRAAEGAAAVLLVKAGTARREGVKVLANIHHAAIEQGAANDDNDAIVDGAAMTTLVRTLPRLGKPLGASFGQHGVGGLRRREWEMAAARNVTAFHQDCAFECVETEVGTLGAAAGAADFVYGLAMVRHDTWSGPRHGDAPFVTWAISAGGERGIALASLPG